MRTTPVAGGAVTIRTAGVDDIGAAHHVIERAYRGPSARAGWTHEADLIEGPRIDRAALAAIVASPADRLLIACDGTRIIGTLHVRDCAGRSYLGMLSVEPADQAAGLGRQLLAAAEAVAADLGATTIEMTVIEQRRELIDYYIRRGYAPTGEMRPFPVALDPPLRLVVLDKRL